MRRFAVFAYEVLDPDQYGLRLGPSDKFTEALEALRRADDRVVVEPSLTKHLLGVIEGFDGDTNLISVSCCERDACGREGGREGVCTPCVLEHEHAIRAASVTSGH